MPWNEGREGLGEKDLRDGAGVCTRRRREEEERNSAFIAQCLLK